MGVVVVKVPFIYCASVVALYGAAFPFLVICLVDDSCIRTHTGVARVVDKFAFKIMRWKVFISCVCRSLGTLWIYLKTKFVDMYL